MITITYWKAFCCFLLIFEDLANGNINTDKVGVECVKNKLYFLCELGL